jgi:hypothetical protein
MALLDVIDEVAHLSDIFYDVEFLVNTASKVKTPGRVPLHLKRFATSLRIDPDERALHMLVQVPGCSNGLGVVD